VVLLLQRNIRVVEGVRILNTTLVFAEKRLEGNIKIITYQYVKKGESELTVSLFLSQNF
jgi:hypothetical protein